MNLREVIQELGIPFKEAGSHHHVSDGWIGVDCNWCSPDSGRIRMGINLKSSWCNCWVCGHKSLYEVLAGLTNNRVGLASLLKGLTKEHKVKVKHKGKLSLPIGLGPLLPAHLRYLRERRINAKDLVDQWSVQGLGIAPALSWRLFIPVFHQGVMISWTTRAIGENPVRYVNAKEEQEAMPMKHTLMGLDHCQHAIVVVEGSFDVFRIGRGAAATMGVNVTREQLSLIAKFPIRIIAMDSDDAGVKAAKRLCNSLEGLEGQTHRVELDAHDAAEASDREINSIRKHFLE